MKKNHFFILLFLSLFIVSCSEETPTPTNINYISFQASDYSFGVDIGAENTRTVKVYTANVSDSDRTFNIKVDTDATTADATAYTVPETLTVPAGKNLGELNVNIKDISIGDGKKLVLYIENTDDLLTGGKITLNISRICPENEVVLKIAFDSYPEEVSWTLKDSSGTIVEESKAGAYDGMTGETEKKFCLTDGTYTFEILDVYSDGAGAYSLSYNGGYIVNSDGTYGAGESTTFTVQK
ncbi:hypothetical protein WH52_06965 [Tenacibaculum holothuriorum]|uniref:Calx-beta domain-containing protein n=1 Tax=Tenacibaculum holothuriorum TaxID=1635173 RepID=A0A1Y2PFP2_9FLAO|nr:DUF4843 domain-containing protein [Tenacibaculum holothuriorum]OSY88488.1 hypothetical protein WH52_06965 [Tenacibaculum holothuriorum]